MLNFNVVKFLKLKQSINKLSNDEMLKALLIEQVYQAPTERKTIIQSYILDPDFNFDNLVCYVSESKNDVIIAIRGTASLSDLVTDIKLVMQQLTNLKVMDNSERFTTLHKRVLDITSKYANYNYKIRLTGHSLSGFEIMRLEDIEPAKVTNSTAFNAGTPPISFYKIPKDVKHIANPLDVISLGFRSDPQTYLLYHKNLSLVNPNANHTIKYFIK